METSFQRSASPLERAEDFIKNETQFHLGILTTEQSHRKTKTLSQTLQKDVGEGMLQLFSVDDDLPPVLRKVIASSEYAKLEETLYKTLVSGGRVGSTGLIGCIYSYLAMQTKGKVWISDPGSDAPGKECGFIAYS